MPFIQNINLTLPPHYSTLISPYYHPSEYIYREVKSNLLNTKECTFYLKQLLYQFIIMASFCIPSAGTISSKALWIRVMILATVLKMIAGLNRVELEVREEKVMRSQMLAFNQIQITNFYNYQYYCKIALGTPPQKAEVILDTGSHHLWVPARNCTNCPITVRKFDINKSQTASLVNARQELKYGKGEIKGFYIDDNVSFELLTLPYRFILADYQKDTQHSQADGIMGLSNYKKQTNIFEILSQLKLINSSSFAFELGLKELRQKSYFYYNVTKEDFPEADYIKASRKDYWTIPVREIRVDGQNFTIKHALVDSGTSLILMPPYLYQQFDTHIFSKFCDPFKVGDIRKCKCPSSATYPNITIFSGSLSFNITPTSYVLGSYNNRVCMLGIDSLPDPLIDLLILGDIFFHHRLIIFDKENNQIGFVSNHKVVNIYPSNSWVIWILNAIALTSLLVVVMVLGLRKKQTVSMLREPLRGGATLEMTAA